MPIVYSLSLLAQNHYMLKPANHPVPLSANHTDHVTIYKYKTALSWSRLYLSNRANMFMAQFNC